MAKRPVRITPALAGAIVQLVNLGATYPAAAAQAGVSTKTVQRVVQRANATNPNFQTQESSCPHGPVSDGHFAPIQVPSGPLLAQLVQKQPSDEADEWTRGQVRACFSQAAELSRLPCLPDWGEHLTRQKVLDLLDQRARRALGLDRPEGRVSININVLKDSKVVDKANEEKTAQVVESKPDESTNAS